MLIFFYLVSELELQNGSPSTSRDAEITFVPRSKSSDVLKKESAFCSHDVKRASSHFNSLKQWGKNRLRAINRLSSNSDDTSKSFKYKANSSDIDDFNVLEAINRKQKKLNEKDRKLSQERKPSYSSSERSLNLNSSISGVSGNAVSTVTIPSAIPVKLRESSALRRHRRTGLGNKDEPHSSSGNWSASSESGRTSIGSEITTTTTHPKSSASSTSLNHHLNHPTTSSSGPPSSIISRRRFLNTSASSSMSEGTATPDLQMFDHDEENSSVYSCDTEGYYTSFHVDSGLKTLKEEDSMTPVHSSMALSSTNSFESSGNQTVLSPENEYELFGKGSTTTSSSAGTVCTAVLTHECERNGPIVPERKSSLTKLNRSGSSNSSGNLERSYSTSTVGSTLEKGGTIKRNGVLLQKEVVAIVHQDKIIKRIESPDSGNNTSSSPVDSISSPTNHNVRAYSEFECSESSDLECVERTERIRVKTTINTSRIPSMCVITPTPSDDDEGNSNFKSSKNEEIKIKGNLLNLNMETGYATVMPQEIKKEIPRKASPLLPLNTMLGKLRGVLQPLKKSPNKETSSPIYDTVGDYVTIADVRTPIKKSSSNGVYYSNEVLKRNLATVLSGNLTDETEYVSLNELPCNMRSESNLLAIQEHEKVDNLNESNGGESGNKNKGALVKLDAQGKVIYSSDSLKRKKGAYTTFSPGPCVKEELSSTTTTPTSPIVVELEQKKSIASPFLSGSGVKNRKAGNIRPVVVQRPVKSDDISVPNPIDPIHLQPIATTSSESPLINIIKSETQMSTNSNNNRIPLNPNLTGYNTNTTIRGAYVNIQDAAPLRNGPPVYSPPSPTRAAAILLQQQEGKENDTIITHKSPSQAPKIVNYTTKLSSKCSDVLMKEDDLLSENIDPNSMKQQVKRSNSYRMAAIYADPNIKSDLSQTKELSFNRLKMSGSFLGDENGLKYSNISKVVTRSFEHLMEEFTKSTNSIISTDISLNESLNIESTESLSSSYPLSVSKIIDLNEFMTDSPFDEVLELPCRKKVPLPLHLASSSPSKVTLPFDSNQHRARFLKDIKQFDTEIW